MVWAFPMKHAFIAALCLLFFACKAHGTSNTSSADAKLNEVVTFDDAQWVVVEAKDLGKTLKSHDSKEEDKTTKGRFVEVHYKVTNKTDKEQMLVDPPKIVDDKNNELAALETEAFYVPANAKALGLSTLLPNVTNEFWTVIEAPADAKGLKFQVRSIAPSKTKNVDLGL